MRWILIPLIGLLCVMYACSNDLTTIGQEIIGNDSYIGEESFPVTRTATIKADSFVTSSGYGSTSSIEKLVIGRYDDVDYSGLTEAIACFQIAPQSVPKLPISAVLDSVTFNFAYAGNLWGDTLYDIRLQKYHLYQLKEVPELSYDHTASFFYNTKAVDIADKPIATTEFLPLVQAMDIAYFKVDQSLGDTLFQRMMHRRDKDDDIYAFASSGTIPYYNFLEYFKGLAIVADDANNCLMTIFSDSLYLEFHYTIAGNHSGLRFPLSLRDYQYNSIVNKPLEKYQSLQDLEEEVFFSDTTYAFTQGMCGYMTKFTLPDPPGLDRYTTIIKAQLEIKPVFMPNSPIPPPQEIRIRATNDVNELKEYLYNTESEIMGRLTGGETNSKDARYIFDMTEYYERVSAMPPAGKKQQVVLSLPNDGYSSTGISFDQMVVRENPIIRVYYAKYK